MNHKKGKCKNCGHEIIITSCAAYHHDRTGSSKLCMRGGCDCWKPEEIEKVI